MTTTQLTVLTAAVVAAPILAAFAGTITALVNKAWHYAIGLLTAEVVMSSDTSALGILMYLQRHGRRVNLLSEPAYEMRPSFLRSLGRLVNVWYAKHDHSHRQVHLLRGVPVLFYPSVPGQNGQEGKKARFKYIRGTLVWEQLLQAAAVDYDCAVEEWRSTYKSRRYQYTRLIGTKGEIKDGAPKPAGRIGVAWGTCTYFGETPVGYAVDDIGRPEQESMLDRLALEPSAVEVVDTVRFFLSKKNWYTDRGLTWKLGIGLHGAPGNAKTSLIRAIAQDFDVPIFSFDLASMTNKDFQGFWKEALDASPRIVLFEDLNKVYDGEQPCPGVELTLDTVLQATDGIEQTHGTMLFVTTNEVEKLPAALGKLAPSGASTRPGRIDQLFEIPAPSHAGRVKIALRITQDPLAAQRLAAEGTNDSGAQFQQRCATWARTQLWSRGPEIREAS